MLAPAAGAPLRAMASLVAIWIGLRILSWNSPAEQAWPPMQPVPDHAARPVADDERRLLIDLPLHSLPATAINQGTGRVYPGKYSAVPLGSDPAAAQRSAAQPAAVSHLPWQVSEDVRGFFLQTALAGSRAGAAIRARTIPRFPGPAALRQDGRWAAYVWIYARHGSSGPDGPGRGSYSLANGQYGGSQAGAILSYRLLDRPFPELSLYGRLSAALDPWSEQEVAFGSRLRPVRGLPVAVHAEQRLDAGSGDASGTAFYVAGGTGPDPLVERFALETYAQAGYVFGRNKTYFFDGSATLQRPIAEFGGNRLALGAGLWAGGQRDIGRLDLGPRASLDLPMGPMTTRIALDGRVRIAGNARPGNGAALTVSTSF